MSRRLLRWLTVAAPILICLAAPAASYGSPADGQLLAKLEQIRVDNQIAAFGLVIVRDDAIGLLATRGLADRQGQRAIADDAIFRIGSISKMFTGLLAAEMAARKQVDLERPVRQWPVDGTFENRWRDTHPVTIATLLEHTAGFNDLSEAEWDYSDPGQLPLEDTLRLYPRARTTHWPPGRHFSYSNAGAGLAGYVLELAGKASYESLLQALVLDPVGLVDTSVLPPPAGRLATGYDSDGETPIPYWHQIFRPFAAINSSLRDMSRFLRLFLSRGALDGRRLFSSDTIARVETPTTALAARRGLAYGYGLGNYGWLRGGILFQGHGGDADGYLSHMGYTRSNNSGYFLVITAFQPRSLRAMRTLVENHLVASLPVPPAPPAAALDAQARAQLTGCYERVTQRFPGQSTGDSNRHLEIFERDGLLWSRTARDPALPLVPVTGQLFRRPAENRATLFIGTGEDGVVYFQEDADNFRKTDHRCQTRRCRVASHGPSGYSSPSPEAVSEGAMRPEPVCPSIDVNS